MSRPWYQFTPEESAHLARLDAEHDGPKVDPYIANILESITHGPLHSHAIEMRRTGWWACGNQYLKDIVRCSIWPIILIKHIKHGQRTPGRWWTSVSGEFTCK